MVIVIQRAPGANVGPLSPLHWRPVLVDCKAEQEVMCANGHAAFLDHEIADDGTVAPSLICPEGGCGFHEFVKLEGWAP